MTATETQQFADYMVEQQTFVRGFELPLEDGWDGRTLDLRIVPYNEPATVSDPPDFQPYREVFLPGAFERQLSTPGRDKVFLNFEHEQGIRGVIGQSLRFAERDDGLEGAFGIHENADGDKALSMIHDGFLTGLSLEFRALASRRVDGVVQRVRAQLDKVSLCRYPAYQGAQVLAVREEPEPEPRIVLPELVRSEQADASLAGAGWEPLGDAMTADELAAAAATLGRKAGPLAPRAAEARLLIRHYNRAGLDAPTRIRSLAGSA